VTTHATLNGTITATGGENCDQRGFEWGYSTGSYPNSWTENGSFGTGAFSHQVTGLTNNSHVFYRAKAHNSAGWGYGGEQSFWTWNSVTPTDSGAGTESPATSASQALTDSVAGIDVALDVEASLTIAESGALLSEDWTCGPLEYVPVFDSGLGTETQIVVEPTILTTDDGTGTDLVFPEGFIDKTDQGTGTDTIVEINYYQWFGDSGAASELIEAMLSPLIMYDDAVGVEFAWRLKGSCLLDDFTLPHVLTIRIVDEAVMVDKKIHPPALPKRKMIGKPGRTVEIEGWTKSQTDIEAMEALMDGEPHIFIHPSGDTIKVLVKDFLSDRAADRYNRRNYRMIMLECR